MLVRAAIMFFADIDEGVGACSLLGWSISMPLKYSLYHPNPHFSCWNFRYPCRKKSSSRKRATDSRFSGAWKSPEVTESSVEIRVRKRKFDKRDWDQCSSSEPLLLLPNVTCQPSNIKRKRSLEFFACQATKGGRWVIARRITKGRSRITA